MPTILPLDSPDATLTNAGGKGINLARLVRAGFPVPPGFVVTTAAYRQFVAANDLQPFILSALTTGDSDDPTALESVSAAIRARFAAAPIPPDLSAAIVNAYHGLITDNRSPITDHSPVAVRSSATAEDLPDMSFAGQQDTVLNVVGDDALTQSVVACWSSLWTARAIAYRARNSIDQENVALAVVVQAMVESESSGVLFTANPLTGNRLETVIDATLGLGEALVSGQVEPDHYVVDDRVGRITEKRLGAKALAIRGQAGGGTVTIADDAAGVQALPDDAILELAQLGRRVERELYGGAPQDIEWARADGRLYLLQSRAITSLYPLPPGMSARPLRVMFSLNHVQGMMDPFTPLGQDTLVAGYLAMARAVGRHFTAADQREVYVAGERVYVDFTPGLLHEQFRHIIVRVPGVVEPGSEEALLSLLDDPDLQPNRSGLSPEGMRNLAQVMAVIGSRIAKAMRDPDGQRVAVLGMVDRFIASANARAAETTSLAEQLVLWQQILDEFGDEIGPRFLPMIMAGMMSFFLLRRLALNELGSDLLALEAARGLPNNTTTEMDLTLWTVAQVIQADPASAQRFAEADAAELAADYLDGALPLPAQVALRAFLDRYGMRGLAEIDLGRARWREDPAHVMGVVQSYLRIDDPGQAPDTVFRRGARAADTAIEQLVASMPNPAKARAASFLASRMRALAGQRETPKYTIIRTMGVARAMLLRSGRELAAAGTLRQAEDIFFLHLEDLHRIAAGSRGDWQRVVDERRQHYERERLRRQIPRLLLSDGRAFYEGLGAQTDGDGSITGSPVSPGVVEGVVHVVFDPRTTQLAPGEILVCPGTDPSWTPLFLAASGLVMEVGGLMTHGSVVAREYGIPAVVGVHEATTRLKTGQRVRVDGTAGRVVVLGEE
ncbi:MAG: phosphoenolpyruvate synthase [Anaerolineae bacterium]|nr:phosphoenolpyruvate synthase [Anaerolineae bacterium]